MSRLLKCWDLSNLLTSVAVCSVVRSKLSNLFQTGHFT